MITVLLADDNLIVREGVRALLGLERDIVVLGVADDFDTLVEGATEANPVMRLALSLGEGSFLLVKTTLTFAGLALLSLHKTWRLGRACLWIALLGYALVTAIHIRGLLERG